MTTDTELNTTATHHQDFAIPTSTPLATLAGLPVHVRGLRSARPCGAQSSVRYPDTIHRAARLVISTTSSQWGCADPSHPGEGSA
jgi:hypothetical protein